jgi:simple sugar transport system ATP-binding protein
VAILPFDRRDEGLLLDEDPSTNLLLSGVDPGSTGWLIDWEKLRRRARDLFEKFGISSSGIMNPVRSLSGGNQQKFLVARELGQNPRLVLAAHPTRGVDWRASRNIHDALTGARDRGTGVLLVSSDIDELCRLSDRIVVILRGRVAGEFARLGTGAFARDGSFDIPAIGLAMTGGSQK